MNSSVIRRSHLVLTASGAGLLAALLPIPAHVSYGPGATPARALSSQPCSLERVEVQYVRCDSLTGAGVAAPPWVPQRLRDLVADDSTRALPADAPEAVAGAGTGSDGRVCPYRTIRTSWASCMTMESNPLLQ